jgi:Fe/S biogenesis protein NfuA
MASAGPVPVHPERVPDHPDLLRWVVPAGSLPFVGEPYAVPRPIRDLLADGTLAAPVVVEPDAVVLVAGPGLSWAGVGARVRRALQQALAHPEEWLPPQDAEPDDRLRRAAERVIGGEVGDYVRGHGGRIDLVAAHDGRVEVSMAGTCVGCPASRSTLTGRFETAVRALYPELREVVRRDEPAPATPAPPATTRRLLPLFTRDR